MFEKFPSFSLAVGTILIVPIISSPRSRSPFPDMRFRRVILPRGMTRESRRDSARKIEISHKFLLHRTGVT